MQLDRVGLDYLINVARDIGFGVLACDTRETVQDAPVITLRLRQTRTVVEALPPQPTATETIQDVLPDVTSKWKERIATLDEEREDT